MCDCNLAGRHQNACAREAITHCDQSGLLQLQYLLLQTIETIAGLNTGSARYITLYVWGGMRRALFTLIALSAPLAGTAQAEGAWAFFQMQSGGELERRRAGNGCCVRRDLR